MDHQDCTHSNQVRPPRDCPIQKEVGKVVVEVGLCELVVVVCGRVVGDSGVVEVREVVVWWGVRCGDGAFTGWVRCLVMESRIIYIS